MDIDEKNCEILQILHSNSRTSLTEISKKVNLSIDSVNKRIKKMIENKIFSPSILMRHRYCGFSNVVEVKIKLKNLNDEQGFKEFIAFLNEYPRITQVFSIAGECDMTIVFIARDAIEQGEITHEIRSKFGRFINYWSESLTIVAHKFENYNFKQLFLNKLNK